MFFTIKNHPILKIIYGSLVGLPSPSNLSSWWNFGSLLGICLMTQLLSGIFLASQYVGDVSLAFFSVSGLSQDVLIGNMVRMFHANGASFFFFCLYFHVGRGLYYGSFMFHTTWVVGVIILLMVMAAAFLGYVLPWGQMSFWGATVITSLPSDIPFIGPSVVFTLWGGLSVGGPTLTRFFTFHFLVPFIVAALALVHLIFLHQSGSGNPLGLNSNYDKISFYPYYTFKDLIGMSVMIILLINLVLFKPWFLGDPENFIKANPLVTPIHIQPEWYFLFAYAILRSIPNKLGGVLALALSIIILIVMVTYGPTLKTGNKFYPLSKTYSWSLVSSVILLTWIGARPVEEPYVVIGQILTIYYFMFYILVIPIRIKWDNISL